MVKETSPSRRRLSVATPLQQYPRAPPAGASSPVSMSPQRTSSSHAHRIQQQYAMRPPQPYMRQIKLHPSGCQQWSSQIVTGGGVYMAYASTLMTYIYDVRDFSLVAVLGGNECNVHSILWHPTSPHRILVLSTNGQGSEWDVRSEERVLDLNVGAPPGCSAWDPSDPANLAIIAKGTNMTYLMRGDASGGVAFRKGYTRRSSDQALAATCAKWSQYERGVLVTGWTDGRVSFSAVASFGLSSSGGGSGGAGIGWSKGDKIKLVLPNGEKGGSVVDLRNDPHKGPYVLVGYESGTVILWDSAAHCSMATFERCTTGLVGIRWMAWAPGNFLALSSKSGVGKIFNISQTQGPIGTVKLGETGSGVRDMAWLPTKSETTAGEASVRAGPRAVCAFRDGSLSVADTDAATKAGRGGGRRSDKDDVGAAHRGRSGGGSAAIPWASKAGHVETVFSCEHRPGDANTLATGSYGSSVKVWHVPTMDLKVTLTGQTGAIYCVAWSLDGKRIASTSGEGTVWIWDVASGRAEQQLRLHSRAVHRVQWDPFDRERLASVGADRSLVIFSDKGAVHRAYIHPEALFGCSWCPTHDGVIATGCKDGNVRVFDCSWKAGMEPQYVLSGHTKRVFHVSWSPLLDCTLASGSDDTSVMVWHLDQGALPRSDPAGAARKVRPSAILTGHTSNVRPLHWNSEVPWLLLSGSWDGTVRAWDLRRAGIGRPRHAPKADAESGAMRGFAEGGDPALADAGRGACVAVMSDHVADVYGLSASPSRPFLYCSVSRDTTLRVFSLEGIASSIKTRAAVGNSLLSALSSAADGMLPGSPTVLCGNASRILETQLRGLWRDEGSSSIAAFGKLFDFFWTSDGMETFWEMIRWVIGAAATASSSSSAAAGGGSRCPASTSSLGAERARVRAKTDVAGGMKLIADEGNQTSLTAVPEGLLCVEERVVHRDARRASDGALARLLSTCPNFTVQDRRLGRSDRLKRAARLHLAAGDLRSSCEAHIALGRWQTALSLAPGVGTEYWRAVAERYIEVLLGASDARDRYIEGGPESPDETALAAALLAATGRPMDAVRGVLKGSEDALSLAVAVAGGAYPPSASPSSEQVPLPPVGEEKGSGGWAGEGGEGGGGGVGGSATERAGAESCEEDHRGMESKLLALIDDHVGGGNAGESREDGAGIAEEGRKQEEEEEEEDEKTSSPKHDTLIRGGALAANMGSRRGRARPPETDAADNSPNDSPGCKKGGVSAHLYPHGIQRSESHEKPISPAAGAFAAAQRHQAEAALQSITQVKADAFFRASQPALAAAAILSTCDGSRTTAASALAFLVRGEEPELAYAAAKVLKFPARELGPLIREMARRAEAWGDPDLSVELLLNAGGEDSGGAFGREKRTDSIGIDGEGSSGEGTHHPAGGAEGAYWSVEVYGVRGEEAGPRGAALVATRAAGGSSSNDSGKEACNTHEAKGDTNPCPSFSLRSPASYLEDAAAAANRGMDVEAVRLLVLGGDLEQAARRGIAFLRENVQPLTFPPRRLHESASAVVRALGSGGGGGLASRRVPSRIRMEALAYASYVGAMQAVARGYDPVVTALLRTASACVQAVETMAAESESEGVCRPHSDEEKRGESCEAEAAVARTHRRTRSPSPRRRWYAARRRVGSSPRHGESRSPSPSSNGARSGRSSPLRQSSPSKVFPPCMSVGALAVASVQHLAMWSPGGQTDAVGAAPWPAAAPAGAGGSTNHAREVRLSYAHRIRDEATHLPAREAKAVCELVSSAEHRASVHNAAAGTRRQEFTARGTKAELLGEGVESTRVSTAASARSAIDAEAKMIGSSGSGGSSSTSSRDGGGSSCDEREDDAKRLPGERRDDAEAPSDGPRTGRESALSETSIESADPFRPSAFPPSWRWSGEIIASGSRIPNCRRHERIAWRTPSWGGLNGTAVNPPPRAGNRGTAHRPLATCSLDFGHDVWPRARGATFLLEDDETFLGLNEAIMWAKVNPFSPLNTGCRMMPF